MPLAAGPPVLGAVRRFPRSFFIFPIDSVGPFSVQERNNRISVRGAFAGFGAEPAKRGSVVTRGVGRKCAVNRGLQHPSFGYLSTSHCCPRAPARACLRLETRTRSFGVSTFRRFGVLTFTRKTRPKEEERLEMNMLSPDSTVPGFYGF